MPDVAEVERGSSRAPGFALLGKALEDLDAELFRRRALDLPELVPEPDHFALFVDGHESPPRWTHKNKMRTESPAFARDLREIFLNLPRAAQTHRNWGFQRPAT